MYILIKGDEDGNPVKILNDRWLQELLTDSVESFGITEFKDQAWYEQNKDPNYWPDGVGVLLTAAVIVPEPARTQWQFPWQTS